MINNHTLQEHQSNLQNHSNNNYDGVMSKEQLPRTKQVANDYFPVRLHKLLQLTVTNPALACLISWNADGTCFRVHNKKAFEREIQPTHFNQSKYASFRRQLNLWSFQRQETHKRESSYSHPFFKRDEPYLCDHMRRSKMKGGKSRSAILSSSTSVSSTKHSPLYYFSNNTMLSASSSESTDLRNCMKITNFVPTCTVASRPTSSKREIILENDTSRTTREYTQSQPPAFVQNKVSSLQELKEAFQRELLQQEHVKENDTKKNTASTNHSRNFNPHTKATGKETKNSTNFNHYRICNISKEEADYLLWLLE